MGSCLLIRASADDLLAARVGSGANIPDGYAAVDALPAYAVASQFCQTDSIIGSAAGVVVMGLERISFGWYMRRISWIAFVGYIAGIMVYALIRTFIMPVAL